MRQSQPYLHGQGGREARIDEMAHSNQLAETANDDASCHRCMHSSGAILTSNGICEHRVGESSLDEEISLGHSEAIGRGEGIEVGCSLGRGGCLDCEHD